jgi:phage head maturation protease
MVETMATDDLDTAPPARLDIPVLRTYRRGVELRAEGDATEDVLTGHFSVFNEWFEIDSWFEGHFLERTMPGSFKRTFNAWRSANDPHRIQCLLEHGYDPVTGDKPLGVNRVLEEDKIGAAYETPLFDATYVRELLPALRAGVYGSSYRFRVIADSWNYEPPTSDHNPDGIPERTITEQAVFEHGPTVFPANPHATAGLRSATDRYYERLRSRNPRVYDQMVARATDLRTSPAARHGGTEPANTNPDGPPASASTRRSPKHARQALRRFMAKELSQR